MIPSTANQTIDIIIHHQETDRPEPYCVQFQYKGMPIIQDQHLYDKRDVANTIRGVIDKFPNYAIITQYKSTIEGLFERVR